MFIVFKAFIRAFLAITSDMTDYSEDGKFDSDNSADGDDGVSNCSRYPLRGAG